MAGKRYYVYILSNRPNGVLYIGVTNNLARRVDEHKSEVVKGFTREYDIKQLVFYEVYGEISMALYREKQLKNWRRQWKINLIEENNKNWDDLFNTLLS